MDAEGTARRLVPDTAVTLPTDGSVHSARVALFPTLRLDYLAAGKFRAAEGLL